MSVAYHDEDMERRPVNLWLERQKRRDQHASAVEDRVASRQACLITVLRDFGVARAFFFGSFAAGRYRPGSDIDIAVQGCESGRFYRLAAAIERALDCDAEVDVIDLDGAPSDFVDGIVGSGKEIAL